MLDGKRIAICTPVHRYLEPDFTASLLKTFSAVNTNNIAWINMVGNANLAQARNTLVAESLRRGCTDIVFIDSDIGWEPEGFTALFNVPEECRIVAGVAQRRDREGVVFASVPDPKKAKTKGHLITGTAGTGFIRIGASVFRDLNYAESYVNREGECRAWFDYARGFDATGQSKVFLDEDYFFAQGCKEEGIEVWLDPTIRLRHHNAIALTERMADHLPDHMPNIVAVGDSTP